MASACFANLPPDCLRRCLLFSSVKQELAALMVTCKTLHEMVCEDDPWEEYCRRELKLTAPEAPESEGSTRVVAMTWRACAREWSAVAARVDPDGEHGLDACLYSRVLRMWHTIESFHATHLPEVRATLNEGAAYAAFRAFIAAAGGDLAQCRAFWYVYSVHDGQHLPYDEGLAGQTDDPNTSILDIFKGIIGGYSAYDHRVNTRLWSMEVMRLFTMENQERAFLPVAGSFNLHKLFGLNLPAGDFVVVAASGERLPVVPGGGGAHSLGMLEWLEEFARRVGTGVYRVGRLIPTDHHRSVILFPQVPGQLGCTRAVTRGVEVLASSIFMMEHPAMWTYSVRIRLLEEGEEGYESAQTRGFETCQLRGRHWIIRDGMTGEVDHVRGEGVIGRYPLLLTGGYRDDAQNRRGDIGEGHMCEGTFIYQSCSGDLGRGEGGTFGGELVFVPGSLAQPTGPDFDVLVDTFPLQVPDYCF